MGNHHTIFFNLTPANFCGIFDSGNDSWISIDSNDAMSPMSSDSKLSNDKVTVHEVAKYAGVSISSVSRALSDHPHVSDALRSRVRSAALSLGYQPDFLRLWEFYLSYCEGGFAERSISNVHLLLAKAGWRGVPLVC